MTTQDIIQIPKNLFYQYRKSLSHDDRDQQLINKVKNAMVEINIPQSTFGSSNSLGSLCHTSSNPSSSIGSSPATTPTTRKTNAFSVDFSRASQQKKFITSYLNKLTEKNKDTIFRKIENDISHYSAEEIDKALRQIFVSLRSHKDTIEMYYDLLMLFDPTVLKRFVEDVLMNDYVKNKEWIPPQQYQEVNIYSTSCDYDLFCKFCSWKNGAIAINRFFSLYLESIKKNELINLYLEDFYNDLQNRIIVDPILEQLECLLMKVSSDNSDDFNKQVIVRLLKINKEDIPISAFFKIQAISSRKNDMNYQ